LAFIAEKPYQLPGRGKCRAFTGAGKLAGRRSGEMIAGVSIPRQSRGHYKTVSRSKRLEGVANATPQGWSHRYGGESPPEAELVKPLVLFLLGLDVLSNHPLVTTDR
jgi:hypothetical protein